MKRSATSLFVLVGGNNRRSFAKVVTKREVAVDIRRTDTVAMQLDKTQPGVRLSLRGVTPSREPEFAPPLVADLFEIISPEVQVIKISDDRQEVENGLCPQAWDRR